MKLSTKKKNNCYNKKTKTKQKQQQNEKKTRNTPKKKQKQKIKNRICANPLSGAKILTF